MGFPLIRTGIVESCDTVEGSEAMYTCMFLLENCTGTSSACAKAMAASMVAMNNIVNLLWCDVLEDFGDELDGTVISGLFKHLDGRDEVFGDADFVFEKRLQRDHGFIVIELVVVLDIGIGMDRHI